MLDSISITSNENPLDLLTASFLFDLLNLWGRIQVELCKL